MGLEKRQGQSQRSGGTGLDPERLGGGTEDPGSSPVTDWTVGSLGEEGD